MSDLYVELHNIRPGLTIEEDVFANTSFPIVKKNTNLTAEHIEVLQMFNVKKVKIKNETIVVRESVEEPNEEKLQTEEILSLIKSKDTPFKDTYLEAVYKYKKEFSNWRLGVKPNIANVRSIIVPLLERMEESKVELSFLYDFSNPKDYLYHHSIAIGLIGFAIGKRLNLPTGQNIQLGIAGTLVDCGMAKIAPSIIEKTAFLTESEFNEVKKHTIYSYQMVKDSPLLRTEMKTAILQHHERLDGSGYPRGDKQQSILPQSQILAVADVYHAMTSERLYRSKESPYKVLELLKEEEFGKFDINVIDALYEVVGKLSIGTEVKLSNGQTGTVIFIHRDAPYRPIVKLNSDDSTLDLTTMRNLTIEMVL